MALKSKSNLPKYLARPSDGAVWSLNKDGLTYSSKSSKKRFPKHIHHKYSYKQLISCDFYSVTEKDFPKLEKKMKEYYEFVSWHNRNDGHGGIKGGTFEEFKQLKKR